MSDLVEATNVLVINAELGPPSDPRQCLQMLVNLGGNLKSFAEKFSADRQEQCKILYQARKILETEPMLLERWDNAVKAYQHNYWSLLQCDALEALGSNLDRSESKEAIGVAKTVLAPFSAQMVADARRSPGDDAPPPPADESEDLSEDDEILAKALGLA